MDFSVLRKKMVDEQILPRGITDPKVIEILSKIERHRFIPKEAQDSAYTDSPLSIGHEQTISQPFIVALMTQCLELSGTEKVLEIGTGSGYQTAILAELASSVYSIERLPGLTKAAEDLFQELRYSNIYLKVGDGSLGWSEESPFDRIIVTAASPKIPLPLIEQLNNNGIMILPVGDEISQRLSLVRKMKEGIKITEICGCTFVPLIGEHGWQRPLR